jgi:glycosyltransferase involved in cell wall biosynthesis
MNLNEQIMMKENAFLTHPHIDTSNLIAVIPAFNEEGSIRKVVNITGNYVEKIIVCNDGSTDRTGEILSESNILHINNKINIGKGASMRALFKEAVKYKPEIIITIDADYQHDPMDIPKLVEEIRSGKSDLVIGSRFVEGSKTDISLFRLIGLNFINMVQRLLFNCKVKDTQSGFRAYSKNSFFIVLDSSAEGYTTESEQLFIAIKKGLKISEVPVSIRYKGLASTSKKFFIFHGIELLIYLISYYIKNRISLNEGK